MNKMILAALLAYCPFVSANELDEAPAVGSRVAPATIPATIVVRMDRTTQKLEVLEVGQAIPADNKLAAKLAKAPFKTVAIDTQLAGAAGQEEVSSTSSWGFGFRQPFYGFNRPYYGGYRPAAYYRPFAPAYGFRPYVRALAPRYAYAGYSYAYEPYYSYNYGNHSYAYCNPPVQTFAASQCACPPAYSACDCGGSSYYGNAGYNPYWNWR